MSRGRAATPRPSSWDAETALEELYAAHWRSLVRLSALLVRDLGTAEEVTQDAFVAMHDRWHRMRDPDKALAYLRQSVVNRSRSVLRHRAVVDRQARRDAARPAPTAPGPEDLTVLDERRAQVLDALARLPHRQREVVSLRYYLDLSVAEVADLLGLAPGTVKSHASRGAAALRESLAELMEHRDE